MRINDLSKELGKTNKEILALLNEKGIDVKSHMANVTDEQVRMVKDVFSGKPKNPEPQKNVPGNGPAPKAEEKKENSGKQETVKPAGNRMEEEPKKKKLTAVFRPQNAQQPRKSRPAAGASQTGRFYSVAPQKEEKKEAPVEVKTDIPEPVSGEAQDTSAARTEKKPEGMPQPAKEPVREVKQGSGLEGKNEKKTETAAETVREVPKAPVKEEVRKAPLVEGRDRVTTFGNVFANQIKKEKTPQKNNQQSQEERRPVRREGQYQNRDNRQTRQGQNPYQNRNQNPGRDRFQGQNRDQNRDQTPNKDQASGQERKPVRPVRQQQRDAVPPQDQFAKKGTNQKSNKVNYKDKNDKRHRTEDGPVKGGKVSKHPFIKPEAVKQDAPDDDIKEIIIPETINIKDLSTKMKLQPAAIVKKLFLKGQIVNVNTELTFEQAEEIALEYDIICTMEEKVDVIAELLKEGEEDENAMVSRPPVVCVMGHVDHGKTSLLDKVRSTSVTSHEAGGITQAIGAYQVRINERNITFLDTPGHEAFTAMRMRGAQSTDIAVLVVAADDGVMPQTVEAINHAKAAGVEIIVAVNKIDKPAANPDRVRQELTEYELIPEEWGGSTIFCNISAKTGEGIENLLEMILLTADLKELKANPDRLARGLVIEAELDKGRGPVATVLVQKGTLHVGDFIAAGACSGKVRAMINDKGERVRKATPSTPVEILGLNDVPNAGEVFVACETDKEAKDFAATFVSESKNKLIEETKSKMSLDDLFSQIQAGNVKELPIIVKADVQGSVEALKQSLVKLSNDEVQIKIIHSGVGAINESDVDLAAASNAIIIGFSVKPDTMAKSTAEHEKVDVRLYTVIYQAIDDIENAMKGMLAPVYEEKVIGHAEIRQIFKASGVGSIAGSYVLDGMLQRGCKARITREGEQIFEGNVASLKRFQDDVKEVKTGYECGIVFEGFNDIREGDQIEGYIMVEVPRT